MTISKLKNIIINIFAKVNNINNNLESLNKHNNVSQNVICDFIAKQTKRTKEFNTKIECINKKSNKIIDKFNELIDTANNTKK